MSAATPFDSPTPVRKRMPTVCVCVGCGCTDRHACIGGCNWLDRDLEDGTGVCSNCGDLLEGWRRRGTPTAYALAWQNFEIFKSIDFNGKPLTEYSAGAGLPPGVYYVVDPIRATVRLVDEQGRVPEICGSIDLTVAKDRAAISKAKSEQARRYGHARTPTPDEIRAEQVKKMRRRKATKAARKARNKARRAAR